MKKIKVKRIAPNPGKTRRTINRIIKERDARGTKRVK